MGFSSIQDAHLNLRRFNLISRCFILWPLFTCAGNFRMMPCGALHHLSSVMDPHCEACEFSSEQREREESIDLNIANNHWPWLLCCSPEVQHFCTPSVMELCVGWELTDVGSHKKLPHENGFFSLQCHIAGANRHSYPDDYSIQRRIVQQIKRGWPGARYIRFHFELRPFIHFWHLQLDRCNPSPRPLGSPSALRPHQPLWKNPVHLTCIAWLHLCVLFGPCRSEEESGPITSRRSETNMMSSPRSAITGCRWEGLGLSLQPYSLNEKQGRIFYI